jgi:hypothetical protein
LINIYSAAMKILLAITLCILLAGNLFAAPPAEDNTTQTEQNAPQQSKPADSSTLPPRAPATSFTPSEKVGADSAVSFPVDI